MIATINRTTVKRARTSASRPGVRRNASTSGVGLEARRRAERLVEQEIGFIPHESFPLAATEREVLQHPLDAQSVPKSATCALQDLPPHLARMCDEPLLSADQEQHLFRKMNYLKYRANALRATLDPKRPNLERMQRMERFLAEAEAARDQIVRANMRLVISLVKRFVTPQQSFDELLSEGTMTLLYVVEKFDYSRGFRFSTYAYRSIARSLVRSITDRHKENRRCMLSTEEVFDAEDTNVEPLLNEREWKVLCGTLGDLMDTLNDREQFIILERYGLGSQPKQRSFQSLADDLGVSKERVRQLERRAVSKLRALAEESPLTELV